MSDKIEFTVKTYNEQKKLLTTETVLLTSEEFFNSLSSNNDLQSLLKEDQVFKSYNIKGDTLALFCIDDLVCELNIRAICKYKELSDYLIQVNRTITDYFDLIETCKNYKKENLYKFDLITGISVSNYDKKEDYPEKFSDKFLVSYQYPLTQESIDIALLPEFGSNGVFHNIRPLSSIDKYVFCVYKYIDEYYTDLLFFSYYKNEADYTKVLYDN